MGPPSSRFGDASLESSSVDDSSLEIDCLISVSLTTSCGGSLLLSLLICSSSVSVVSSSSPVASLDEVNPPTDASWLCEAATVVTRSEGCYVLAFAFISVCISQFVSVEAEASSFDASSLPS